MSEQTPKQKLERVREHAFEIRTEAAHGGTANLTHISLEAEKLLSLLDSMEQTERREPKITWHGSEPHRSLIPVVRLTNRDRGGEDG